MDIDEEEDTTMIDADYHPVDEEEEQSSTDEEADSADDAEQPIALAFSNSAVVPAALNNGVLTELVYEHDIFWGTIYLNYFPGVHSTLFLTLRNNARVWAVIDHYLPFVPAPVQLLIASFVHIHF
jgi:hypothetical protein